MSHERLELFVLKCATISSALRRETSKLGQSQYVDDPLIGGVGGDLVPYINQFDLRNRINAMNMAEYYRLLYMLENDIRELIEDTLGAVHGASWWQKCVPQAVREEGSKNLKRESEAGISLRSNRDLDYITFGQLGEIIRSNWGDFAGIFSNQPALSRVLSSLNMSRAAIAHCGILAEDEVDRLRLNVKDWFRVLAGPTAVGAA